MIRLILISALIGLGMYFFATWRSRQQLDAEATPLAVPEIKRAVARLAPVIGVEHIPVNVLPMGEVNGLAAPDGRVFITQGFLDKHRLGEITADEIASVVAHELGHVALGHSKKRMITFAGQNALNTALAIVLARFIPFFGIYIANFITRILVAGLSRADEYEADAYAAALMTKAGIGVGPQLSLFEKLGLLGPKVKPSSWLMSHPDTKDRIAAIERLSEVWNPAIPISDQRPET